MWAAQERELQRRCDRWLNEGGGKERVSTTTPREGGTNHALPGSEQCVIYCSSAELSKALCSVMKQGVAKEMLFSVSGSELGCNYTSMRSILNIDRVKAHMGKL